MKLAYKEDPKEWRKSALLAALGLALFSSLLRWRKHLPPDVWLALLALLAVAAMCATLQPRWFRGWYRISLWLGFYSSQLIGRCVLLAFFALAMTPLGILLRLAGKDCLQLKRPREKATCWRSSKDSGPLDRLF